MDPQAGDRPRRPTSTTRANPIPNPETADRGGYTDFCGYIDGGIEVQDREGKRVVSDGGALESFLLEAATENKALDAEQLRAIQASRDKQRS